VRLIVSLNAIYCGRDKPARAQGKNVNQIGYFVRTYGVRLDILAVQISIMLIVMSIGISATWQEAVFLFRRPALLLRSVVSRNIIMPIVAIAIIRTFSFHPAVEITIGLLAATPVPPILPLSLLKAGGRSGYIFGLLVSQAVLAIIFVPLIVKSLFPANLDFSVRETAGIVLKTILGPLGVGLALSGLFGDRVHRVGQRIARAANILLLCALVPLIALAWGALKELVGEGLLLGLPLMVGAGLAAGHLFGGPDENDRTVLALATAAAHPGVAIAIAGDFPEQRKLVAGVVLLYLILRAVLVIPYVRRRGRPALHTGGAHAPAPA